MDDWRPVDTSLHDCEDLETAATGFAISVPEANSFPYREAFGSLMYLLMDIPSDLPLAVGKLLQFYKNPILAHKNAVIRGLIYMEGTVNSGLFYTGRDEIYLRWYSDSYCARDVRERRSTSHHLCFVISGITISLCFRKQTVVASSTYEEKFISLNALCKEFMWI